MSREVIRKSNVIPAQPGYFILEKCVDIDGSNGISLLKTPIVAWVITYDIDDELNWSQSEYAKPVTYDDLSDTYGILSPCGTVIGFQGLGGHFIDEQDYLDCIKEYTAKDKENGV